MLVLDSIADSGAEASPAAQKKTCGADGADAAGTAEELKISSGRRLQKRNAKEITQTGYLQSLSCFSPPRVEKLSYPASRGRLRKRLSSRSLRARAKRKNPRATLWPTTYATLRRSPRIRKHRTARGTSSCRSRPGGKKQGKAVVFGSLPLEKQDTLDPNAITQ